MLCKTPGSTYRWSRRSIVAARLFVMSCEHGKGEGWWNATANEMRSYYINVMFVKTTGKVSMNCYLLWDQKNCCNGELHLAHYYWDWINQCESSSTIVFKNHSFWWTVLVPIVPCQSILTMQTKSGASQSISLWHSGLNCFRIHLSDPIQSKNESIGR